MTSSQQFARERKLVVTDRVLVPRTKGFEIAVNAWRAASTSVRVIDLTVAYERRTNTEVTKLCDRLFRMFVCARQTQMT